MYDKSISELTLNLFDETPMGILVIRDLRIIYVNKKALEILKYEDETQLIGLNPGILSPEYQPIGFESDYLASENIKIASETGYSEFDWVHKTKDGDILWIHVVLKRLLENSDIIIAYWKDITEQKRLAEVKTLSKIGCWELNLINSNLYWSDEVYDMFAVDKTLFSPDYSLFLDAVHPDDREMVDNAYLNSVKNKEEYLITHRVLLGGEVLYYRERGKTQYSNDRPIKSIGTVQDVTIEIRRENEMRKKDVELLNSQSVIIQALANVTELRDEETGIHITATRNYMKILLEAIKNHSTYYLDNELMEKIIIATPLHDIGKIKISDEILLKKGKYTQEEFEEIKKHPVLGWDALQKAREQSGHFESEILDIAQNIILYHHEKWDGTGYPNKLSGKSIPLEARIMALIDVYDALVSKRVYKPAFPHEKAVEIIKQESGRHFDPEIVRCFLKVVNKFKPN